MKTEALITNGAKTLPDRRRDERLPASGMGTLHWADRWSGVRSALVNVRNVCQEGVTIELPEAVEAPRFARLTGGHWQCLGWLRYCEEREGKIVAGFQFTRRPYPKNSSDYRD